MAMQSSGQIKWSEIQATHGGAHPISISEYYGKYYTSGGSQRATSGMQKASYLFGTSPSIAGGFTGYSSWGSCSVSCGGGTQSRTRSCTSPSPTYGGAGCSGSTSESQSCNTHSCCWTGTNSYTHNHSWSGSTVNYVACGYPLWDNAYNQPGTPVFDVAFTNNFTRTCNTVNYTLNVTTNNVDGQNCPFADVRFYNSGSLVHTSQSVSSTNDLANTVLCAHVTHNGSFTGPVDSYSVRMSISQGSAGGPCTFTPQANLSFTSS